MWTPAASRLGVWIALAVGTLKMHRWQGVAGKCRVQAVPVSAVHFVTLMGWNLEAKRPKHVVAFASGPILPPVPCASKGTP